MATQVSLIAYLQQALPGIPTNPPQNPGPNTTNISYSAQDIHGLAVWQGFALNTILQRYQNVLTATHLPEDPIPISPPQPINSENPLRHRITELVLLRVRRALRAGFTRMTTNNLMNGLTALSFDVGEAARTINMFVPDTAYYVTNQHGTSWNRAPGDVKPSWKWNTAQRTGTDYQRKEYRQALSQVNYYMKQHSSRYGFVLTDHEMVAVRRLDDNGNLQLSNPIPWDIGGTAAQPQLTVLLALWYLGMLAAHDQGADQWRM